MIKFFLFISTLFLLGSANELIKSPQICDNKTIQYSGYIDKQGPFFWFIGSQSEHPADDPVILWMSGGPGITSLLGLHMGIGPCNLESYIGVQRNPYAWNSRANLVFVDLIPGVGFTPPTAKKRSLLHFIRKLYKRFPKFANNPLHVFSENGGAYILLELAGELSGDGSIPLRSVGLGNPLIDPELQIESLTNFACPKLITDRPTCEKMALDFSDCRSLIRSCQHHRSKCPLAFKTCMESQVEPYMALGMDVYSTSNSDDLEQRFYRLKSLLESHYSRPEIQKQLGARLDSPFSFMNQTVEGGSHPMLSAKWRLEALLKKEIRVMLYVGELDFIINWLGVRRVYQTLSHYSNLEFFKVPGAGHKPQFDQPKIVHDLVLKWVEREKLQKV